MTGVITHRARQLGAAPYDRQVLIAGSPQTIENTRRTLIIAGVRASRIQHDPVF